MRRYLTSVFVAVVVGMILGYLLPHSGRVGDARTETVRGARTPWAEFVITSIQANQDRVPGSRNVAWIGPFAWGSGVYPDPSMKGEFEWFAYSRVDGQMEIYISTVLPDEYDAQFNQPSRNYWITRSDGAQGGLPVFTTINFSTEWTELACKIDKSQVVWHIDPCDKKKAIDHYVAEFDRLPRPLHLSVKEYL